MFSQSQKRTVRRKKLFCPALSQEETHRSPVCPWARFAYWSLSLNKTPQAPSSPHLPGSHTVKQRVSSFVQADKVPTCLSLFTKGRGVSRVRMGGWDHCWGGGHLSSVPGSQALSSTCCLPLIFMSCQLGFLECSR